jgi:23S rRNA (cytosine1962-C5)-methyltransferase
MRLPLETLFPHWRSEWVLHDDEHLLAVDKPAGVATEPLGGEVSDVPSRIARWRPDAEAPAIMHPLDREVSGVLLLGKSREARRGLHAALEAGVARSWLAAVDAAAFDGAKARLRELAPEVVERGGGRALVRLSTQARSQPVRRRLAEAGAPCAGDREGPPAARLGLHIERVELLHPQSGAPLVLVAPCPGSVRGWVEGGVDELPTDARALEARLRAAADRRHTLAHRGDTDAFRIAHGGGDDLPGVEVDRYGDFAVVSLRTPAAMDARDAVLDAVAALGFRGVYVVLRPREPRTLDEAGRESMAPRAPLRGEPAPDPLLVHEHGLAYEARLGDGFATGIFLDQRLGRARVRELARGKRVLNLFAYCGAFTVAAAAGGAARTVTVDASAPALERARRNLALTGGDPLGHELLREDAAGCLRRFRRRHERFDVVVLDPPSFSTTRRATFRAARDYAELAALAMGCLAPGGVLVASTNHRRIERVRLRAALEEAAVAAAKGLARLEDLADPSDHPPPPGEAPHLKTILAFVS